MQGPGVSIMSMNESEMHVVKTSKIYAMKSSKTHQCIWMPFDKKFINTSS